MSKWTHSICEECWTLKRGPLTPTRMKEEYREKELCCFCGKEHESGIYLRGDPHLTGCQGRGLVHERDTT